MSKHGGGVRGLSSLLILEELMNIVNTQWQRDHTGSGLLEPRDVFDLIVGTSTGGLIALMLVKLGLNVTQAISKYEKLSKDIFSNSNYVGRALRGRGPISKFDGEALEVILKDQVIVPAKISADHELEDVSNHEDLACAVVCREIDKQRKRKKFPILLCSHRDAAQAGQHCHHVCRSVHMRDWNREDRVKVLDAARATCTAPTYFAHKTILGKMLVDGGYGDTNNPSHETFKHYFRTILAQYQKLVFVNLGTGTAPPDNLGSAIQLEQDALDPTAVQKRSRLRRFGTACKHPFKSAKRGWKWAVNYDNVKAAVQTGLAAIGDALGGLTDCEDVGDGMLSVVAASGGRIVYKRHSADRDSIHAIGLSQWKKLREIREATTKYLADETTKQNLEETAHKLLEVYAFRQRLQDSQGAAPIPAVAPVNTEQAEANITAAAQVTPKHQTQRLTLEIPDTIHPVAAHSAHSDGPAISLGPTIGRSNRSSRTDLTVPDASDFATPKQEQKVPQSAISNQISDLAPKLRRRSTK